MIRENWHHDFNPGRFLQRVQLQTLLKRAEADADRKAVVGAKECLLCHKTSSIGIILNDKAFLCEACLSEVALISYPEKYEQLWRHHLIQQEARRLAYEALSGECHWAPKAPTFWVVGFASLVFQYIHAAFGILSAAILVAAAILKFRDDKKARECAVTLESWNRANPPTSPPTLKHFHDPTADLTKRDQLVLRVFEYWPGYPPFWSYLRDVVLARDHHRCQVTGCPSRFELHIHHVRSKSNGGAHAPANLVTLCKFHHAIEPERGHERIWGEVKTSSFTFVPSHQRSNRSGKGKHAVTSHLRRHELVTLQELSDLHITYGFCCKRCQSTELRFELSRKLRFVKVTCKRCSWAIKGPQQLTEETGPRIAENLCATRNAGVWKPNWEVLSSRIESLWKNASTSEL